MRAYTGQNIIEKQKTLLPSFLSGRQNRNVDGRKEYNMTFSEESGIGYQKMHLTPTFFAWILHSFPYFFITLFPTAFFLRSRMTGKQLMPFHMKSFFVSAHTCPFRQLRRHFPRVRGQLAFSIFYFAATTIQYLFQNAFHLCRHFSIFAPACLYLPVSAHGFFFILFSLRCIISSSCSKIKTRICGKEEFYEKNKNHLHHRPQ